MQDRASKTRRKIPNFAKTHSHCGRGGGGVFQNLIFYNSISCLFALMDDLTKPSSCLSFLATHFMNRRERFKIVFSPIFFMLYREQGNLKAFSMSCLYNNVSLLTFVEKCPVKNHAFWEIKVFKQIARAHRRNKVLTMSSSIMSNSLERAFNYMFFRRQLSYFESAAAPRILLLGLWYDTALV